MAKKLRRLYPFYSPTEYSLIFKFHIVNKNYLVDVVEGASRCNLDGTVSGACTLADAEYSRGMLKRLEIQKIVEKQAKR